MAQAQLTNAITYQNLIDEIKRHHELKESEKSTLVVSLSVAKNFLKLNEIDLEANVDPAFISRINAYIENPNNADNQIAIPKIDTSIKARVGALVAAFERLTGKTFKALLAKSIESSKLTLEDLEKNTGIAKGTIHLLKSGLKTRPLAEEIIVKLDDALTAGGQLKEAYFSIYQPEPCSQILTNLAGKTSFASLIQQKRKQDGRTLKELATCIGVTLGQITEWQQGKIIPTLEHQKHVEALDRELEFNGLLVKAWRSQKPRAISVCHKKYALKEDSWPAKLKLQVDDFISFHTGNPKQLKKAPRQKWRSSSCQIAKSSFERIFGFFIQRGIEMHLLTLLMICDWTLIKEWLDFVRDRVKRESYNHSQKAFVLKYTAWLKNYFSQQYEEAADDPYWQNRRPVKVMKEIRVANGVLEEVELLLNTNKKRWAICIEQNLEKAKDFIGSETFENAGYINTGKPFLDSKVDLKQALPVLGKQLRALPKPIKSTKDAVSLRRIAMAFLMVICPFRKGQISKMLMEHLSVKDGRVHWDIPSEIVKNKKNIIGLLANIPDAHEAIIRYNDEARPILLGSGTSDYWIVSRGGGNVPVDGDTIYNDIRMTLGVSPHAMRYVLITDGRRKGFSNDDLSNLLRDHPDTIPVYDATDEDDVTRAGNKIVEKMFDTDEKQ